jgi:predicted dehydrogenase
MRKYTIAFVGAGGVGHYHAYALAALPSYYSDVGTVRKIAVASGGGQTAHEFARRHSFEAAVSVDEIWERTDIDTLYILSPNALHFPHLVCGLAMPGLARVYIEKPLCVTQEEEEQIAAISTTLGHRKIQLGFQFLQLAPVRKARLMWREGCFGTPIHFRTRYLHSGYLDPSYRRARADRMKPAPEGGAMSDLGSHGFSLISAFLGDGIRILSAVASPPLEDVPQGSDLYTVAVCRDDATGAVGIVEASRISAGASEVMELEFRCTEGGFRFRSEWPDMLEVFSRNSVAAKFLDCSADYAPESQFPKSGCPSGWLRAFVHANYLFLADDPGRREAPGLDHGLAVQRLLRQTAAYIRDNRYEDRYD